MLRATTIAQRAGGQAPAAAADWPAATGAEFHADRISPGDIFFALKGAAGHGLDHAGTALRAGAAFIVSDMPHPRGITVPDPRALLLRLGREARPLLSGKVIGVTGSSGKTSTKELLAVLLGAGATPGNLNTELALSAALLRAAATTADRPLVLELGIDREGEMRELLDLTRPDAGLLTHIGASHLDGLGSLKGVIREKRLLTDSAPLAFVSSQAAEHLGDLPPHVHVYGLGPRADEPALLAADGSLHWRGLSFRPPLAGVAQAENLAGALMLAATLGVSPELAAKRLATAKGPPGRLEFRRLADGRLLIDDSYNSNPASAAEALAVLRTNPGPRAAVLGDMRELGPEGDRFHRELGEATRDLDLVVAVGRHAEQVKEGNPAALTAVDTEAAAELLKELPHSGTVLVKASRSLGFERLVERLVAA